MNKPNIKGTGSLVLNRHKRLALALSAEGWLAQLEQRTNDAVRSFLDAIRLGHEVARWGLRIDHLVGMACEALGSSELPKIVPALSAKECRAAMATLESTELKRESPDETLRNERTWSRQNNGLGTRIGSMIWSKSFDPVLLAHKRYLTKLQVQISQQSQILIDLATRAYQLENGRPPANLNDLVPAYLKAIPQPSSVTN